jgi:hypothetical protein
MTRHGVWNGDWQCFVWKKIFVGTPSLAGGAIYRPSSIAEDLCENQLWCGVMNWRRDFYFKKISTKGNIWGNAVPTQLKHWWLDLLNTYNSEAQCTVHCNPDYSSQTLLAFLGSGSQRRTFLCFQDHALAGWRPSLLTANCRLTHNWLTTIVRHTTRLPKSRSVG